METRRLEIDQRTTPEIEVTVWLLEEHDLLLCSLVDLAQNRGVEFIVEPDEVSEALQHPYYVAARHHAELPTPLEE